MVFTGIPSSGGQPADLKGVWVATKSFAGLSLSVYYIYICTYIIGGQIKQVALQYHSEIIHAYFAQWHADEAGSSSKI